MRRLKDSQFFARYFDASLDLRVQSFHLLGFAGMAAGVGVGLISLALHATLNAVICAAVFLFASFLMWRTGTKKMTYHTGSWLVIVVVFMISFPILFFTAGGYRSGTPCFFVFAIIYTAIMLEGKGERIAALTALFVLYTACCLVAYHRPETVMPFPTEYDYVRDVITGVVLSGALLTGVVLLHIGIYNDRQKRLLELDKLKSEFLENVSHELKTPITVTRNYAVDTLRELQKEPLNVPEMAFNQGRIKSESERLERMVSQLLNVTSIDGGRRKLRMERISLAALLSRVTAAHFHVLNDNDNKLSLAIQDDLPDIAADPDAIEQVLVNLLSNAARHTKEGEITVGLTAKNGCQTIRVSDNGEGMPPHIREQVFLRYVERESRITGRSGMGLYICKKLIDAHGGEIGIESEPNKGTEVCFKLMEN
jgi:signal transduction histidine kinase